MEFHVSRRARERYGFAENLFATGGRAIFPDFAASRRFAQQINAKRNLQADPGRAVRAGDINAMGLIDEILHHVVELYREQRNPRAIVDAHAALEQRLGADVLDSTLGTFVEHFPTATALREEQRPEAYLAGETDGVPNRQLALEELLLLWLANMNTAFAPLGELFDDRPLEEATAYAAVIRGLEQFFATQPGFGPDDEDLITVLRRPALESPDSLAGQLLWMRQRWGLLLTRFGDRLAVTLDVLTEEERAAWMRFHATHGGGGGDADTSALHGFADLEEESERFSHDRDWMPRLVLMAKSTYVWLDQLARAAGRPIWRLDQIPDEELDRLAEAGITGLWLIGLWERSHASQRIKQMRGSPEAVASAYSLMDYRIADDLGGEEAYGNLRERAWARGIRLASDMVPNHMGIDSRWVIEHPDWFMSRPDAPYPSYSYNGPNLSSDERVGIYIEDHYFDNTDAAVTFKREDRWSGEARYVYHGNDGTSMPWNDTAQLDYVKPEVREAVIQTILHVARLFPVIRFDAAMTLAKKHVQRLWYPEPGSGGAIPSRAEYSMSRSDFDRAMPQEFWREVVDRVAQEAPDTLLLAEAFWLMEGYFVRTLGMHRVYNSAFMNMLRDEKNAEYRLVIKNTLEFDPQILKRYVNFMNNPDERTAIDQFGDGDKYFGVCTLMSTMPGLPMFGHGQLEGFSEKYGMEFRRANLQEEPRQDLLERHAREIYPLLHRRELFAEVDDFVLYDFHTADGAVNEDVFAYSNRRGDERALIVFHNRYAETAGRLRLAAAGGPPLARALRVDNEPARFLLLRDQRSGLEYLRSARQLHEEGLYLQLHGYQCHVFIDMRDIHDDDGRYGRLADWLGGRGVPDIAAALRELELQPFHDALRRTLDPALIGRLLEAGEQPDQKLVDELDGRLLHLVREARALAGSTGKPAAPPAATSAPAASSAATPVDSTAGWSGAARGLAPPPNVAAYLGRETGDRAGTPGIHACWLVARTLDRLLPPMLRGRWLEEWQAGAIIAAVTRQLGAADDAGGHAPDLIAALLSLENAHQPDANGGPLPGAYLGDEQFRRAIGVNEHDGVTWFGREQFERTIAWLPLLRMEGGRAARAELDVAGRELQALRELARQSGYRLGAFVELLAREGRQPSGPAGAPAGRRAPTRPRAPARPRAPGRPRAPRSR